MGSNVFISCLHIPFVGVIFKCSYPIKSTFYPINHILFSEIKNVCSINPFHLYFRVGYILFLVIYQLVLEI